MEDNTLNELKELTLSELKKIVKKNDMTPTDLDLATKAVCLLEHIKKNVNDDYKEDGYSGHFMPRMRDSYGYNMSGMRTVRSSGRNNSNGYSGHSIKDRMIDKLECMVDEASSDYEREQINEWIRKLDSVSR